MKRLALLIAVAAACALVGVGRAAAAIQVSITSPADGAHSLKGVVQVNATASADNGIYSVQLYVDGNATGVADTTPVGQYQYTIPWDVSGVSPGDHTLAVEATDWSGTFAKQMSDPIHVDVGPDYPTVHLTAPAAWSLVRGSTNVTADATSAVGSAQVAFTLDGSAISSPWDTTKASDGSHTIRATVTDGRGKTATDSETVTVDNTGPENYLTAPAANGYFTGSMAVQAHASDLYGLQSVQFAIDGNAVGSPVTQTDSVGSYTYSATLDVSKLANGAHQLTSIATDSAGNKTTSAAVTFNVGAAPIAVTISTPPDWTFQNKTTPVTATVTGGVAPISAQLLVDGKVVGQAIAAAPYTFQWDTTKLTDGGHTVAVTAKDAAGKTATSPVLHETVDNTAPTAVMYQPLPNARITGTATFQVHASDAYGVKSVQFTVDGKPVGALLTAPDAGQTYLYTIPYDTTQLADGTHAVAASVTDGAGNVTVAKSISIITGASKYLPVLNYHEIAPPDGYDIYDQTPAEADAQLAYLKQNGYQSVTLEQYQAWLGGQDIGIAKPVLITVDDGLKSEMAWDALLQKYGFKAVMFVITGYADQTTPGDRDPNNMTWTQIQSLANNGRWQIAFHAGVYGHGDSYADGASIMGMKYPTACPYFYTCLGQTTTGSGKNAKTTPESVATYKLAVTAEVNAGIAELKQKVPNASLLAWAAPFNDAGQWTNLYNDPTGEVQAWLPGFMASKFPLVFTQTNPVQYGQASGTVGSLSGFNRHYRFEVHTDTTIQQLAAALADPAFAR
ncbi:MAG TPA: Ig-like domain-containing protein [Gaiellaceae bacterium]